MLSVALPTSVSDWKHGLALLPKLHGAAMALLGTGAGVSLFPAPAGAQDRYVSLTASTQYDDNLQRRSEEHKSLQPHEGQEIITLVAASAGLVADLGQFDVQADGTVAKRLFIYNEELNSDEYQLNGRANYAALSGTAAVEALVSRQNLSFGDPIFPGTSVRNLIRVAAEGDRAFIGNIRFTARASYQSSSSPDAILSRADNDRYSYSVGLRYVSPIENRLELGYRESVGEGKRYRAIMVGGIPTLYSADSTDRSIYTEVEYAPSSLFSFTARTGYTWHDDRSVLDSDFEGLTYAASSTWHPTRSVTLVATTSRSFSSNDEMFANGVKSSDHSLAVRGDLWDRVAVNATARYAKRNFRYDLQTENPDVVPRSDRFLVLEAGAQYRTGIGVDVGLQFRHTRINDSAVTAPISDNLFALSLSRRFQL